MNLAEHGKSAFEAKTHFSEVLNRVEQRKTMQDHYHHPARALGCQDRA